MRIFATIILFTTSTILLFACQGEQNLESPIPNPQEKDEENNTIPLINNQDPEILADSFFFGCAYLDENDDGILDENDPMIGDMTFTITLNGGGGFGGRTAENDCAMIIVPGGLTESHWPVSARMLPPEGTNLQLIGPEEIQLERNKTHADFLFSNP